jgi:hypothetical protein
MSFRKTTSKEASLRRATFFFKLIPGHSKKNPPADKKSPSAYRIQLFPSNASVYLDNIRKPVVVIALGLVVTGCAHLANVKTTQPGAPRLMVGEQQLRSATEHLARARHEQSSLSLGNNLSAAKLSLDVLER